MNARKKKKRKQTKGIERKHDIHMRSVYDLRLNQLRLKKKVNVRIRTFGRLHNAPYTALKSALEDSFRDTPTSYIHTYVAIQNVLLETNT